MRWLLYKLIGEWQLERQVIAASSALTAKMDGIASFVQLEEDSCRYQETGTLTMLEGTQPLIAFTRSYLYRAEQNGLAIFFDESPPRLFQRLVLSSNGDICEGEAVHLCGADTYTSHYRFMLPQGFETTHNVQGPRKLYAIQTSYRRLG